MAGKDASKWDSKNQQGLHLNQCWEKIDLLDWEFLGQIWSEEYICAAHKAQAQAISQEKRVETTGQIFWVSKLSDISASIVPVKKWDCDEGVLRGVIFSGFCVLFWAFREATKAKTAKKRS